LKKVTSKSKLDSSLKLCFPSDSIKDNFPSWLSIEDQRLLRGSPKDIVVDVIVARDGSGKFKKITQAIANAWRGI
jgi:hypothetical protein